MELAKGGRILPPSLARAARQLALLCVPAAQKSSVITTPEIVTYAYHHPWLKIVKPCE